MNRLPLELINYTEYTWNEIETNNTLRLENYFN